MPSNNASTDLSLPAGISTIAALLPPLNDRMRQIEQLVGSTSKTVATTGSSSTSSSNAGQVILSVPGTLGMLSTAAPLILFQNAVTPSNIVAVLTLAAIGAPVIVQIMVAGVSYAQLTIPAGQQLIPVSIPAPGGIAAGALVTLNIISVGTTFPGAGLSVILQGVS